ncbi:MAG: hypothetical protein HY735_00850 [Verrucomicrobia bacterium]|nr:hypothetical protein [Verrucomicrobiota bacterium]
MASPVAIKVSAELAESAREAAEAADRSLTGQIEHWAKIGRAAEAVMPVPVAAALKLSVGDIDAIQDESIRRRVIEALEALRTKQPGEIRKLIGLDKNPAFEPDPNNPDGIIRVDPDGTRTRGTLKRRTFVPSIS